MPKKNMITISMELLDQKITRSRYKTATELAEDCYLSRTYFSHVRERGTIPAATLGTILNKLKITMEDFLAENEAALQVQRDEPPEEAAPVKTLLPTPLERIAAALEGILAEIKTRQLTINDFIEED